MRKNPLLVHGNVYESPSTSKKSNGNSIRRAIQIAEDTKAIELSLRSCSWCIERKIAKCPRCGKRS